MVYSKEDKERDWEFLVFRFLKNKEDSVVSSKDIKSIIKDKEIRLFMSFDSDTNMPEVLKKENVMVFPKSNKSWLLVKTKQGIGELPEIKSDAIEFEPEMPFKIKSSSAGMGEQQYVLNLINSGIIFDFLNARDKKFFFSIMGKQVGRPFKLKIDKREFDIPKPRIEIDAGLEGEDSVILIEAKAKLPSTFNKRQLFFPYMHCKQITGKKVIPVFFAWDGKTKTFNLWKFEFKDDRIDDMRMLDSKRYRIKE